MDREKQIEALKGVRALSKRGVKGMGDTKLMIGDLVEDTAKGELGIFLGVKSGEGGDHLFDYLSKQNLGVLTKIPPSTCDVCVLLTISKDPNLGDILRVRYTNSKYLKKIEGVYEEPKTLTDLEIHCKNECFLECDPGCSLWKYRKA